MYMVMGRCGMSLWLFIPLMLFSSFMAGVHEVAKTERELDEALERERGKK